MYKNSFKFKTKVGKIKIISKSYTYLYEINNNIYVNKNYKLKTVYYASLQIYHHHFRKYIHIE